MSRRVRDRGPRRRCASDRTLVRTRPAVNVPPPPIPLNGMLYRMMTAVEIADYEGLATGGWSSGSTGNINGLANSAWQCLYHHRVQTTPSVPYSVILPPVRWSIACPSSDGGTYDFWNPFLSAGYVATGLNWVYGSGLMGLSDKLMPSGHFAEFANGYCQLNRTPGYSTTAFACAALQAIAPTVPQTPAGGPKITIAAIRHRVNGSAVGSLIQNPGSPLTSTDWRFDISKGDTYALDVWYRFEMPASSFSGPIKAAMLIPQYRILNNSKRLTGSTSYLGFNPVFQFSNINFSPNFNYQEQTYEVTISGHTGWTLKDGSDGPHKIISGGGWTAAISNGSVIWRYNTANGKCNLIVFWWDREIPHVEFYPGPTHSGWEGSTQNTSPLIFRPVAAGYRTSTNSTDFSTLAHVPQGTINQAGTTTFSLVQEITDARPNVDSGLGVYGPAGFPDAFEFGAGVGILNEDIPTTITITRVSQ